MKLVKGLGVVIAVMLFFVVASAAQADSSNRKSFDATLTEDFAFLGCPVPVDPAAFTCGTAKARGFGNATVETFLTEFTPIGAGCFVDSHSSRLTFKPKYGSLVIDISGTLCGTGGGNFVFDGTYTIAGGTGQFAGATGSGSAHAVRQNGPIAGDLAGSIALADDGEED